MIGVHEAQSASPPWLLCLNLKREYVTPGRPLHTHAGVSVAARARSVLYTARRRGWVIAHVQSRTGRLAHNDEFARPIEGLEPLPSEPIFQVRQRSALAHVDLRARLAAERPPAIYLAGFALAHEGLATLFDAVDLGLSLRVLEDAAASPALGDRTGCEIDRAALAIAASLSAVATSAEVLESTSSVVVKLRGI